ncbi:MAG: CDP-diacylglycerol--glycerol-3-phosphate 3-phosphatidyltransferase [Myxococcota bacterium]|nr:CDP-diacylglycerol--glycerol-3-phosphate 3-phosphatidyltransferase [Myxococcota bacterium]
MATSYDEATAPEGRPPAERLWNLPNTITMLRTAAVPVLMVLPWLHEDRLASQVIAWIFILAAVTDLVDGWLARRGQQVTRIGKLLDPLADKLLVSTALIVLLTAGRIPDWGMPMVVVIVGRELAVTGLRGLAVERGQVMAAAWSGKVKAVFQNIAIGALLFPTPTLGLPAHVIGLGFLVAATGLTLWSGYGYFASYFGRTPPVGANEESG